MTSIEKKLIRTIRSVTNSYDVFLFCAQDSNVIEVNPTNRKHQIPVPSRTVDAEPYEVEIALRQIADKKYILLKKDGHDSVFTLLPRINHRFDYWRDEFSTRFLGGFAVGLISGIILAVIAGIVIPYLRTLIGI